MKFDAEEIVQRELPDWQIVRKLGKGGFKDVYLVERGGVQEALKITRFFDIHDPDSEVAEELEMELRARTEREVRLLGQFGGGSVVTLGTIRPKEFSTGDGRAFFYSEEYLPGEELSKAIPNNVKSGIEPDRSEILNLFQTGLDIIEMLSDSGVLHRDIKPQNIMKTTLKDRTFVFFDLGIAFDKHGTSYTKATYAPGTLMYRAPETLDPDYRSSIDFRCDLFSLAVTVFEFATGIHPIHHGSRSPGETVYRLLHKNAEPLARFRPDLPASFAKVIDKCLHKKPALRPNRLSQIRKVLGG